MQEISRIFLKYRLLLPLAETEIRFIHFAVGLGVIPHAGAWPENKVYYRQIDDLYKKSTH